MSNHIELKYHKKRTKKVHPYDNTSDQNDGNDLDEKSDNKKTEKMAGSPQKARSGNKAFGEVAGVIKGIVHWKRHTGQRLQGKRGESQGREGPADQGLGLGDFDENFTPDGHDSTNWMNVAVASRSLHDYFKELYRQSHRSNSEKENRNKKEGSVAVNFDRIENNLLAGARIDWPDVQGQTIIHEAARAWSVDVAMCLLDENPQIKVDTPDKFGRTPLHVAAIVNNVEVAKYLLKNGADKEARTETESQTPVHYAAKCDSYAVMKALIKAGCKYKVVEDYKKRTPLQLAAENGVSHMVSMLLALNAPANVQDDEGQLAIVLIMKNTRSLARDAMDQFIKRDPIRRQQTVYMKNMVPKPIENRALKPTFAQTPLEVLTANMFYDLVTHDIIKAIINIKWKQFGKCGAVGNLILHLLFILVWTVLGVIPDWTIRYKYNFPHDVWRVCVWVIAITLTVYEIVAEVMEYSTSKTKLKDWKAWKKTQLSRDMGFCHPQWPMEKKFLKMRMCRIDNERMVYLKDWWNVLDWICYSFLMVCFLTHVVDALLPVHSVALARAHIRIMVFTLILVWLRLMKSARAFAALGPFIVILGQMINDFAKFIFLYVVFYIPYLCAFWMIFGGVKIKNEYVESPPTGNATFVATTLVVQGYRNWHKLLFSLFRLTLVDEYPYDDMNEIDPIMSDLLVASWFALSTILCINLFIALLSDTFQRVYDNAQANGLMLKAITIMEIEGNLPKKILKKHIDFIHKEVEAEDYEEDVSKGESDLKKVAFQVKLELEEMREWFSDKFGPAYTGNTFTHQDLRMSQSLGSTTKHQNESYLSGEIKGLKQDMASLKGMLEELVGKRQRGGRGGGREGGNDGGQPADAPSSSGLPAGRDVVDGVDDVDNTTPYLARSQSLIPLYDRDEYDTIRNVENDTKDVERRHVSRRRKKKKKHSRHHDDEEDPRGLVIHHRTSPIIEVDSFAFMEPPPQQIGRLQTPEPQFPDSTEA